MSLSFINSETVKQAVFEELQKLLSSDARIREISEQHIKHLEFTEGYGVYLSEIIMNQSFDLPLRQMACIMLTRYVENHWSDIDRSDGNQNDPDSGVASEAAKRTIRNILPNGLYDPNSKIRSSVAHAISTIASTDWPDVWTDFLHVVIKCLGGNEDSIHGATQILEDFIYNKKEILEFGPIIMAEMYRIFKGEQTYSVKTLTSVISILLPLVSSITVCFPNKKDQIKFLNPILDFFMENIIHYLSADAGYTTNFLLRTEIISVLSGFVDEMPSYIKPHIGHILAIIWQLLTQLADVYVKKSVNQIVAIDTGNSPFTNSIKTTEDNENEDENGSMSAMIVQIFELISYVIQVKAFRPIIKNVLVDLIYITIVYMQVSEEQIENWTEDPEKLIDDDNSANVNKSIRASGQELLKVVDQKLGPKALCALQEALSRHVNVAEAEKSAGNRFWWKIPEACMAAVHVFSNTILQKENQFDLPNYLSLVRSWLQFNNHPCLLGTAVCTLSTYSNCDMFSAQMLQEILNNISQILKVDNAVLQIYAIRAVNNLIDDRELVSSEKYAVIQGKLPEIVESFLAFVPESPSSVMCMLLKCIIDVVIFDRTFTISIREKLVSLALGIFLKHPECPYVLQDVRDLIEALCEYPECLQLLEAKFIPAIASTLELVGELALTANQDIALDVLTIIVERSQAPLSSALIETAFPAMIRFALRTDDISAGAAAAECLKVYISVASQQVGAYKNGEGLTYIMQVVTMLLNPMNNESAADRVGYLVITLLTKMGSILGENADLLLKASISKMQLTKNTKMMMSLVVLFSHLFVTQMAATLNFLSTLPGPTGQPAINFVLNKCLATYVYFSNYFERKITTTAFCKLFEYAITTQDTRLTSLTCVMQIQTGSSARYWTRQQSNSASNLVTVPLLVKVFRVLIAEMCDLLEENLTDNESDTEEDDDNDNDNDNDDDNVNDNPNVNGNGVNDVVNDGDVKTCRNPFKNKFSKNLFGAHSSLEDDESMCKYDPLTRELLQSSVLPRNMKSYLGEFLINFVNSNHYSLFASHLNDLEKDFLQYIQSAKE